MADNTQINLGTNGDTIRTVERTATDGTTVKTQVLQIDIGGDTTETGQENLVTCANPLPVQSVDHDLTNSLLLRQLLVLQGGSTGFVPMEIPSFLIGV